MSQVTLNGPFYATGAESEAYAGALELFFLAVPC